MYTRYIVGICTVYVHAYIPLPMGLDKLESNRIRIGFCMQPSALLLLFTGINYIDCTLYFYLVST